MPSTYLPIDITQGEDFTVQFIWTDEYDEPMNVVYPCQMDVKDSAGQTILSMITPDTLPEDGSIPEIALSSEIGLIQVHIPREQTKAVNPGIYNYDLFVTVNDDDVYVGDQQLPLIYGPVTFHKRYTRM
jgi:hypothetical protein